MADRRYRGDDRGLSLAWQTPPWMEDGETVDAPGDRDRDAGEERTEGEVDTERALDRLDALDRGDGDGRETDADAAASGIEGATAVFARVVAREGPGEAVARLLRTPDREGRA